MPHHVITWTNVYLSSVRSCGIHQMAIWQVPVLLKHWYVSEMASKIKLRKFQLHFQRANELKYQYNKTCL